MRHDKLGLQLELLLMLTENKQWTVEQMCERLDIGKRNLYYYLEFFKGAEFNLVKHGRYYSISRQSKFISRLCDIVKFTEDEAIMLKLLLDGADDRSAVVRSVKQKLARFYDFDIIENDPVRRRHAEMASRIYEAIKYRNVIFIRGYSSSHSHSVTDRKVEPFLLMNGGRDLRAYEPQSGMNKTFRIARMADVEILDEEWTYADCHRQMFSDYFNFASETLTPVRISMDRLAYNVLVEEYPRTENDVREEDGRWILATEVCSMLGIGRFVLGLYDHIDIIDSPELADYVKDKIAGYGEKHERHNQEK
ncbi:WYL domain-containing protein [Palleniella muris]|uniref:WYL domain-containing protein n=1 Tax=Palleniella muris TaxID=3038145 RepID=A0AC61QU67_9BACT|nr:WYL domain-containing protein [Palleniella muris]TGX84182.1 WYL domain-containing protein [Palleniella muris]